MADQWEPWSRPQQAAQFVSDYSNMGAQAFYEKWFFANSQPRPNSSHELKKLVVAAAQDSLAYVSNLPF